VSLTGVIVMRVERSGRTLEGRRPGLISKEVPSERHAKAGKRDEEYPMESTLFREVL